MDKLNRFVVFTLDEQRLALPLSATERIVRAVEVTLLPKAPEIVLGVINIHGQIIPVVNIRNLFHLPERGINLNGRFILVNTATRTIVILANEVYGVVESSGQEVIADQDILPDIEYIDGVIKLEDKIISIIIMQDFDRFLTIEETPPLNNPTRANAVEEK